MPAAFRTSGSRATLQYSTLQCAQRSLHIRTRDIELPYPDEYDLERVIDDFVRVLGLTLHPKTQPETKPYTKADRPGPRPVKRVAML